MKQLEPNIRLTEMVLMRTSKLQKALMLRAASAQGLDLSQWARTQLIKIAMKQTQKKEK